MGRPGALAVRSTVLPQCEKLRRCPQCGSEFGDPSNYRRHLRIHTNERPYHCHVCQAQFTTNQNRQRHIRHVHAALLNETSTSTPSVAEEFSKESVLPAVAQKSPKPSKTTGEQTTFVCPHCEQELCSRSKLTRHLRYSCPFRDDVFVSSSGSSSGEENQSSGISEDHGRHAETKRSRRIRRKRHAADVICRSPLLYPRHETNLGLSPLLKSQLCSVENLFAVARQQTKTPSRVVCPYDACLSTFRTRRLWMNHVMTCHPQEIVAEDAAQGGGEKKGTTGSYDFLDNR